MRKFLFVIFILKYSLIIGQDFSYPAIVAQGKSIIDFVPNGWIILDSAYGDLNKDRSIDVALVLQRKEKISLVNTGDGIDDTIITNPRILIILFKESSRNAYLLKEQSNTFILNNDNASMEDPYQSVQIKKGILKIDFQLFANAGSWYVTNGSYKFRYEKNQFLLIGADYSSFHRATHEFENYSYNFLTNKRTVVKGTDEKQSSSTSAIRSPVKPLKTLKTFNKPFTWEVESDVFL